MEYPNFSPSKYSRFPLDSIFIKRLQLFFRPKSLIRCYPFPLSRCPSLPRLQAILFEKVGDSLVGERRVLVKVDVVGSIRHEYFLQLGVGIYRRAWLVVDPNAVTVADYIVRLASNMLVERQSLARICSHANSPRRVRRRRLSWE